MEGKTTAGKKYVMLDDLTKVIEKGLDTYDYRYGLVREVLNWVMKKAEEIAVESTENS